jgi:hypothetical protein
MHGSAADPMRDGAGECCSWPRWRTSDLGPNGTGSTNQISNYSGFGLKASTPE